MSRLVDRLFEGPPPPTGRQGRPRKFRRQKRFVMRVSESLMLEAAHQAAKIGFDVSAYTRQAIIEKILRDNDETWEK